MEHISMSEPRPLDRSGLTQTRLEYVMKLFFEIWIFGSYFGNQ